MEIYLVLYENDIDNGVMTEVYPEAFRDVLAAKYYIENECYLSNGVNHWQPSYTWKAPNEYDDIECETSCKSRWIIKPVNLE
jgi:hypothetical protein